MSDVSIVIEAYEAWKQQRKYLNHDADEFSEDVEMRLAAARWRLMEEDEDDDISRAVEAARAAYTEEMVFRDIL